MPLPSRRELLEWAENYVALWNAGEKKAWVANWKKVAPGDFRMLDPVGTPEKRGLRSAHRKPGISFNPRFTSRSPTAVSSFAAAKWRGFSKTTWNSVARNTSAEASKRTVLKKTDR